MEPFEELEHTADLGLRVRGATLEQLLVHAARGMFSLIGRPRFSPEELRPLEVAIPAPAAEEEESGQEAAALLLHAWLRRLLEEFNRGSYFPVDYQVRLEPGGCRARLLGGTFDAARHPFGTEIKGVTLHGLRAARMDRGWTAQVIFDV